MLALSCCALLVAAADGDRKLTIDPGRGLPAIEAVTVYATKDGKRAAVAEATKFDAPLVLAGDGPFEVVVKPKGGLPVRAVEKLEVKAGAAHALKLTDVLGAVEVFGDDLPRPDKVVVTDVRDPGPGEKGHVAVQSAGEYRVGLAVPPGTYAVWVLPANGAKAQRVADNIRVKAGSTTRVE
ncbi:MAG: hypothetical protein C0501_26855 [Isosphaera sp.]|nr:hypothetical protein [Isosphaera sp.]